MLGLCKLVPSNYDKILPGTSFSLFLISAIKPEAMYVLQQIKVLTVGVGSRIELLTS